MCSSKKGISALQLQRELELGSYRTAWFMCHRVRWAMTQSPMEKLSGVVEADETYVGGRKKGKGRGRPNFEESKNTPVTRAGGTWRQRTLIPATTRHAEQH